jgi:hypothetical protein
LIAERAQDTPAQLQVWLALLDMYRAAGMQAASKTRPWTSWRASVARPAMVCDAAAGRVAAAKPRGCRSSADRLAGGWCSWRSRLQGAAGQQGAQRRQLVMDWSAWRAWPGVQKPLLDAAQRWADEKGSLVFAGHERLLAVLSKHTLPVTALSIRTGGICVWPCSA